MALLLSQELAQFIVESLTHPFSTHSCLRRQLRPAFDMHRRHSHTLTSVAAIMSSLWRAQGELSHTHVCGGNYIQSLTCTGEYRGIISLRIVMISHDAQARLIGKYPFHFGMHRRGVTWPSQPKRQRYSGRTCHIWPREQQMIISHFSANAPFLKVIGRHSSAPTLDNEEEANNHRNQTIHGIISIHMHS